MRRQPLALAVLVLLLAVGAIVLLVSGSSLGWPAGVVWPSPTRSATTGIGLDIGQGAAARSEWYAVWFTSPKYPDDPSSHRGGLDESLVALMDRAERTMDVAVYDFDLSNVAAAMARAQARGVRVRMVTDTDTLTNTKDAKVQAALEIVRSAGIRIVDDRRGAIMHDKFTVVDGEWVSTGSWNYTEGDTYRLNNWMGVFRSRDLAANYTAEFERMFEGRFGGAKNLRTARPSLTIGGASVRNCFSPEGGCANLVVDVIQNEARQSIHFLAFSFTHDAIGSAIVDKHRAGLKVVGVFETTGSQTPFSEFTKMKREGLEVYADGNPYAMHHKVILLDERVVVGGSFNFSSNADKDNDENLLVVDDAELARAFKAEFDRVLAQAKQPPETKRS